MHWSTVAAERGALADDLTDLSEAQWDTPSLCAGWTVRQVLAHQAATAAMTPPRFFRNLAASRFNFDAMVNKSIAANVGVSPTATLSRFRSLQNSTSGPPGPKTSWLGETIVHAEDIRRPLGIAHEYPVDALKELLDFYAGSNLLIGAKKRLEGLSLVASDTDYSRGAGGRVEGPMLSLLMAATGRKTVIDDLEGPGVSILRAR